MLLFSFLCSGNNSDKFWLSLEEALEDAKTTNKQILLFFEADWCIHCKALKQEVFEDAEIKNFVKNNFYPVKLNFDNKDQIFEINGEIFKLSDLTKKFNVESLPLVIFVNYKLEKIAFLPGYFDKEKYCKALKYINSKARQ